MSSVSLMYRATALREVASLGTVRLDPSGAWEQLAGMARKICKQSTNHASRASTEGQLRFLSNGHLCSATLAWCYQASRIAVAELCSHEECKVTL